MRNRVKDKWHNVDLAVKVRIKHWSAYDLFAVSKISPDKIEQKVKELASEIQSVTPEYEKPYDAQIKRITQKIA